MRLATLSIAAVLTAAASYASPRSTQSSVDSVLHTAPEGSVPVTVHVRMDCPQWAVLWDYTDSLNYRMAEVRTYPAHDALYQPSSVLRIRHIANGQTVTTHSQRINHARTACSVLLQRSGIRIGDGIASTAPASLQSMDLPAGSRILLRKPCNAAPVYASVDTAFVPSRSRVNFQSAHHLRAHLAASKDTMECMWQYMDGNLPAGLVTAGGQYMLATVRSGNGYNLVYMGGDNASAGLWAPLDIKGRITETDFVGNYDLEWTCSHRTLSLSRECYATTNLRGVLTLCFPQLGATLRLRRISQNF